MYDPVNKIRLIKQLKWRLIDKGMVRDKVIAEEIARRWVTKRFEAAKRIVE